MPRPLRIQAPGAVYHVTVRGVRRTDIFRTDDDRRAFLFLLRIAVERHQWRLVAYCLMTNHFHLVVQTPQPNIAAGMQQLNGRYAAYFNAVHRVEGHVFERRYAAAMVEGPGHLAEAARYVVLNPVRAGICTHPSQWPWSSYHETRARMRRRSLVARAVILGQFTVPVSSREAAYVAFVEERIAVSRPP